MEQCRHNQALALAGGVQSRLDHLPQHRAHGRLTAGVTVELTQFAILAEAAECLLPTLKPAGHLGQKAGCLCGRVVQHSQHLAAHSAEGQALHGGTQRDERVMAMGGRAVTRRRGRGAARLREDVGGSAFGAGFGAGAAVTARD